MNVTEGLSSILGEPYSGKVRDIYPVPGNPDELLIVASDRVSTHNVTHQSLIGQKGEILNALPIFYCIKVFASDLQTHLVAWGKDIYEGLPNGDYHPRLHYSAVRVRKRKPSPREFIYRRFHAGSFEKGYRDDWREYGGNDPYGHNLPPLSLMHRFAEPLFTPTRKSKLDEPLPHTEVAEEFPLESALTKRVFMLGERFLKTKGITLIDGKCEASRDMLIDEWLTGDCCRMAWTRDVQEGVEPPWLDKEVLRREAMKLWQGGPKVPLEFPEHVRGAATRKNHEAFEAITDMTLSAFQKRYLD